MTPDELRARCELGLEQIITFDLPTNEEAGKRLYARQLQALESLCREMIVAGLERADEMVFGECSGYAVDDFTLNRIRKYIKAEAQRVKHGEGPLAG